MIYLIDQLFIASISILSVAQEWYATYPYREAIAPKGKQSHLYHLWGWFFIGFVCFSVAAIPLTLYPPTYTETDCIRLTALNGLIYWNIFDMGYSFLITKRRTLFYLGQEARLDGDATKVLGNKAGLIKAILVTAAIIVLNLIK